MINGRSTRFGVIVIIIVIITILTFAVTYFQLDPMRHVQKRIAIARNPIGLQKSSSPAPPSSTSTTNTIITTNSDIDIDTFPSSSSPSPTPLPQSYLQACQDSLTDANAGYDGPLQSPALTLPSQFEDYIAWHARQRRCFVRSGRFCDPHEQVRILVWKCFTMLCGGVGDRMRGIRFLLLLSIATKRLFFIDWPQRRTSPYPLTLALLPASIDWRLPNQTIHKYLQSSILITTNTNTTSTNVTSLQKIKTINAIPAKILPPHKKPEILPHTVTVNITASRTNYTELWDDVNVIFFTNRMPRSSIHHLSDNPTIDLPMQIDRDHIKLVKLERMLMKLLFVPSKHTLYLSSQRMPTFRPKQYLAAHVRTGIDVGEGKGPRLGYIATHLEQAARRLWRCILNVNKFSQHIFLASDSIELKHYFMQLVANHSVTHGNQSFTIHTEFRRPLHIDRKGSAKNVKRDQKKRYHTSNETEDMVCVAFLDVFADIFALARADSFVYFHSGFAATAESFGAHRYTHELKGDHGGNFLECSKWNIFERLGEFGKR